MLTALRVAAAALFILFSNPLSVAAQEPVTVFAAASLKGALDAAGQAFSAGAGALVRASYAASSVLARQVEQGAPADLFASADTEWMDYLAARRLIRPDTRVDLLGNRLVVVAPREGGASALSFTAESFAAALGADGRVATGEVKSVPAGRYAKAALEALGLWAGVQPRLAQADNVRAALALVARGEAPLGIVYASDALSEPKVTVVASFPPNSHPPIVYPFALTTDAKGDAPARFLAFLRSPAARPIFEGAGFLVLEAGRSGS
jgi:molybdate transport system substrate-binding protein